MPNKHILMCVQQEAEEEMSPEPTSSSWNTWTEREMTELSGFCSGWGSEAGISMFTVVSRGLDL